QARIFREHGRCRTPRRIDLLVGDFRHALPAVLFAGDGNWVTDGLPRTDDKVQPAIAEADDDFAWSKLSIETHKLTAAAIALVPTTPIPKQLGGRRLDRASEHCQRKNKGWTRKTSHCRPVPTSRCPHTRRLAPAIAVWQEHGSCRIGDVSIGA